MTEITAEFNLCLRVKNVSPIFPRRYDFSAVNTFLQEAYSINARISDLIRELRTLRPRYLSTATRRRQNEPHTFTDRERDELDAQSKLLLRQLNGAIIGLKAAEDARLQTADSVALSKRAKGGLGALGRWAAGGAITAKSPEEEREEMARKSVAAVRESILLYLSTKLEEAGRVQSEMMDTRLRREVEKSKSMLAQSRVAAGMESQPSSTVGPELSQDEEKPPELTQAQLEIFAEENHALLKHYNTQLDQVRVAEKSILEISELHSTLHANLTQQAEHIEQLVQDSYLTTENLGKGNKELKKASERKSTAQAIFYGTVVFCTVLVGWDLFI